MLSRNADDFALDLSEEQAKNMTNIQLDELKTNVKEDQKPAPLQTAPLSKDDRKQMTKFYQKVDEHRSEFSKTSKTIEDTDVRNITEEKAKAYQEQHKAGQPAASEAEA
jgi:hypothetical protein